MIPAAGFGRRMGADMPKQYLPLDARSVLEVTLARFIGLPGLQGAVLALAPGDTVAPAMLANFADFPLFFAEGGATRSASVRAALQFLVDQLGVSEQTWVMVHDAARPCVRGDDIMALLNVMSAAEAGGLLAIPVRDTLKRADTQHHVLGTVSRESVYHALTPQAFSLGMLAMAMDQAAQIGAELTDESSAIEWIAGAPVLVEGHADNLKITHPNDLPLARLILQSQGQWHPPGSNPAG